MFIICVFALIIGIIKPDLVIKWGSKKEKNRKNVLKVYGLSIVVFFVLFVNSIPSNNDRKNIENVKNSGEIVSESEEKTKDQSITLEKITGSNDFLKNDIMLLKENSVDMDSYKVSIVGFKIDSSSGDPIEDAFAGEGLSNETFDESVDRGLHIGFQNSKAEVKNRDEYLSLYLKFAFNEKNITRRDSIIPKFKIKVKDEKDDECILVYNSHKDKYIDLNSPYVVILYKTFSDSQEFEILIDDNVFILNKLE